MANVPGDEWTDLSDYLEARDVQPAAPPAPVAPGAADGWLDIGAYLEGQDLPRVAQPPPLPAQRPVPAKPLTPLVRRDYVFQPIGKPLPLPVEDSR